MANNETEKWQKILHFIETRFTQGETPDMDAILFLIGVQELGKINKKFKKDDKLNLMHIAVCRLLEPFGFYLYDGLDADGWPHYTLNEELPPLKANEQQILMKKAIIQYFEDMDLI
jgi:hypothetical protein